MTTPDGTPHGTPDGTAGPGDSAAATLPVPGLVEPARQRLLAVADEVLGRLPAEDVPPSLRAVARFTPSKRRRLGATALAGALDNDDAFRERVAEAAAAAAPELVAVVRDKTSTAVTAADPVDLAVLAYLVRPTGWEQVVVDAARRWHDERPAAAVPDDEVDALRAEVAELRAAARGESARLREAATEAAAAAQDELAALRRTVRDRTRELRAAERDRDAAQAAAQETGRLATARVAELTAGHEAELQRARARADEAERAGEAVRRGARVERDVDDARLWLLVDTIVQAAAGVRRELSLAPPSLRPADSVQAADVPGAGRSVPDAAALDGLLALPHVHLVVDGYNVTKTGYPELPLAEQRTRLTASLAALAGRCGAEVTVVFDGAARPPVQPPSPRGVRVLFSAADEIADDLIRRLVAAEPAGRPVVVVTGDQQIVRDTARAGVWSAPAQALLARLF